MRRHSSSRRRTVARSAVLAALVFLLWPAAVRAEMKLAPDSIRIGAFFDGAYVRVTGEVPQGASVVVEVSGKRTEQQLLRKGRHWDIWMNLGEVDVENAPSVYFALSTAPDAFSSAAGSPTFGYARLRQRVSFKMTHRHGLERRELFKEFVALKESEGLYGMFPGGLHLSESSPGQSTVEGEFRIPSRIDPGDYQVRLSVVEDGRVLRSDVADLRVQMGGLPALLSSLAQNHGALYGLLAIFIAVVFGFLIGVIFRKR